VNFAALRRAQSQLSIAFVASAALFLGSCGGGGASGTTPSNTAGEVRLSPEASTLYAGVPYTINIVGGRRPYLVTSSEQTLVALNFTINANSFEILANNPGVIDVGLDPDAVPSRTVNITVTDSAGQQFTSAYNVLQNFFTGYGVQYSSTCASVAGVAPQACSGLDSIIRLSPVSQGTRYGARLLQLDKIRGDFQFVQEDPNVVPQLVNQLRVTTDQTGLAIARLRVSVGAPTQIATYRVTDVRTGVTTDQSFIIVQQAPSTVITLVPNTFTFTGGLAGTCGTGSGQSIILGGAGPFSVQTSNPLIIAGPNPVAASGDRLSVTVPSGITGTNCPTGVVTVIDSQGAVGTINVTSQPGSGAPPPIALSPSTLTLTCTAPTGSAAVIGGNGSLSAVSSHPRVQATISGNILTVSRLVPDVPVVAYPATATIAVTDGASIVNLTASVPASCP
jgi:hypothetical protein